MMTVENMDQETNEINVDGDVNKIEDITEKKDGGVIKEILIEGSGHEKPQTGDKVQVHYVGMFEDGSVFDSSIDRGEKFSFTLGKSEVIKGWDIVVKTMRRGEKVRVTLKPEYAYGERGSLPKIPGNATLIFEIQLFDWRLEDLTKKKDGGVRKRIIVEGEGFSIPNEGATVEIHLITMYEDNIVDERDVTFLIGEGSEEKVIEGVELGVSKMKKGEKSKLFISREYAWGSNIPEEINIPDDYKEIVCIVEVKNFEKMKESWEMDGKERVEQAELAKNKGTNYFKQGKYSLALKQYKRIIKYIGPPDNGDFDDKEAKDKLLLAGYLNLSLNYLKLNKPLEVIKNCNLALELDANNEKGLFRRAQAYFQVKEYERAINDYEQVIAMDPNNKAAKNGIVQCKGGIKAYTENQKRVYKDMFAKFAKKDEENEKRNGNGRKDVWNELNDEKHREFLDDNIENVEHIKD